MPSFVFEVGKANGAEEQNYIKKLLAKNSCASVQEILLSQDLSIEQKEDAHTFWTVCGHRVREKIRDLCQLETILKKVLPIYLGSEITLYRGENLERYYAQHIGFCWTTKIDVARMFARGLNSKSSGGVVLKHHFHSQQIISAPSKHSIYLGEHEYTVAPSTIDLDRIMVLDTYPAVL